MVALSRNVSEPVAVAVTAPAAAAPAAAPARWSQGVYLAAIRSAGAGTTIADQTDADLIHSGRSLCADIDRGYTWATFKQQTEQYDVDTDLFRKLLRAAVYTYCPQQANVLP